jgi:membrane peptidoglycan carboxypeptidase
MDRVMRRSDRILRRMAAAGMISPEEYRAAAEEVPNLAGLERKVEKTLTSPPPEEPFPADPERVGAPR